MPEVTSIFELLSDLQAVGDIQLDDILVYHVIDDRVLQQEDSLLHHLEDLQKAFDGRSLHCLLLPMHLAMQTTNLHKYSVFSKHFGMHMNTAYLLKQQAHLASLQTFLNNPETLRTYTYLALPTNVFTLPLLPSLAPPATAYTQLAMDIYATHRQRPGSLLPNSVIETNASLQEALADVQRTLNACMKIEQQFLQKVRSCPLIPPNARDSLAIDTCPRTNTCH